MQKKLNINNVLKQYRAEIGQTTIPDSSDRQKNKTYANTSHEALIDRFHTKLRNKDYDHFNSPDLTYFFQWVATRAGFRYSIANMSKEAGMMKRLLKDYSPREVCEMIDFLFNSEQAYLDKDRLSPNVLVSAWKNTIFRDTQAWLKDEYTERPIRKPKLKAREWGESPQARSAVVGEWD